MSSSRHPAPGVAKRVPAPFVELWGDVVAPGQLAAAIGISAVISVGTFLLAGRLIAPFAPNPSLGQAYAMLAGLVGCVVSGAICARLFPPKRDVVDEGADAHWRDEALAQLQAETGSLGDVASLPTATADELKEVGLYESFASSATAKGA